MDNEKLRKELAKLRRLYREFPFLSQLVTRWHPEYVDIGVFTMTQKDWKLIREKHFQMPARTSSEIKVWFKIKALEAEEKLPYDALVEFSPTGSYNYEDHVVRFRKWGCDLKIQAIEYVIDEEIYPTGRKIILVIRPPKPNKSF